MKNRHSNFLKDDNSQVDNVFFTGTNSNGKEIMTTIKDITPTLRNSGSRTMELLGFNVNFEDIYQNISDNNVNDENISIKGKEILQKLDVIYQLTSGNRYDVEPIRLFEGNIINIDIYGKRYIQFGGTLTIEDKIGNDCSISNVKGKRQITDYTLQLFNSKNIDSNILTDDNKYDLNVNELYINRENVHEIWRSLISNYITNFGNFDGNESELFINNINDAIKIYKYKNKISNSELEKK
ncbi:hypothetical protein BCR32DRAFT_282770 [Anaeromyces robustus]|uniref:Uncharacterized protein n=1 Tax=Anaeromyces robustus TaxID=1754192 RepID=A0A1Y1WWG3_9FUNG|nr:hypothetical protein BCR32DRAFT_282770 [Anaeromyces robustus]|eukprot:ORX77899.1 hypothetical protein BCR32DRAFT_282770 [Anaeromyces robustus]